MYNSAKPWIVPVLSNVYLMKILCFCVNIDVRIYLHDTDSTDVLEGPGISCGNVDTSLGDILKLLMADMLVDRIDPLLVENLVFLDDDWFDDNVSVCFDTLLDHCVACFVDIELSAV